MYGLSGVPEKDTISKDEVAHLIDKYRDTVNAALEKAKAEINEYPHDEIPLIYALVLVTTAASAGRRPEEEESDGSVQG